MPGWKYGYSSEMKLAADGRYLVVVNEDGII
jgi:hypothetical protein